MQTNEQNKEAALQFLKMVIAGKIDDAYRKYVSLQGKHHNAFFPAGFPALREAMKENHEQSPKKQFKVMHVLGDGDLVAVHSHLVLRPGDPGMITVHLFRFKNDKIVEFWDCGQAISSSPPNSDGVF